MAIPEGLHHEQGSDAEGNALARLGARTPAACPPERGETGYRCAGGGTGSRSPEKENPNPRYGRKTEESAPVR